MMLKRPRVFPCVVAVLCLLAGLGAAATLAGQENAPSGQTAYAAVDPMIGTAGGGNTFPGASLPFGMMQWSPDTGLDGWYDYGEKRIHGFSLTHLSGAGCPLYGDFPVLPWTGDLTVSPDQNPELYTQAFDHGHEQAHPGYYAVTLADGIEVQITVSERGGIARFLFPEGQPARLLVNAGGSANSHLEPSAQATPARSQDGYRIRLSGNDAVEGSATAGDFCGSPTRYTVYFAAQFQQPFAHTAMWKNDTVEPSAREEQARHDGAWLDFGDQREVVMKVGVSFVSTENARANLQSEIPGWDFDAVHSAAQGTWSQLLSRVEVQGGSADQRTIFYTGLYHMLLSPTLFSDRNGQYIGFDDKVHSLSGQQHAQYANYSDWDIYRNVVQLQTLLDPSRAGDMAQSLVNDAEQSGWLPRWPAANDVTYVMGGDSPAVLLSDYYAFGGRNFDVRSALRFMVKAATQPGSGPHGDSERPHLAEELKLGFVPVDNDSIDASRTLEYASDDFAIAQFAQSIGDHGVSESFMKRAGDWQNLLDPETKWIRPRYANSTWLQGFDPERSLPKRLNAPVSTDQDGFEEGNTWQYSFMIPFDYPRLIEAMGGSQAVVPRLDKFFSKLICWGEPCFNMANEPDFVTPYTYAYTTEPWKTDDVITRVEQQTFNTRPDGIPGNDDLGATSGVYVWNALGMYPGVPGVAGMFLGTPMFPEANIHFADGRTLEVRREGSGVYVRSISLDGQGHEQLWLLLDAVPPQRTTTLRFDLQPAQPASTDLKAPPLFRP